MTRHKIQALLLGATILAGGGAAVAIAQEAAGTYDPGQMPALHGKVAQYDLTPRGDVDGLILDDGTEAHVRPDLGTQLVALVHPGDAVTIHGLKARVLPLVQAMSITNDASGRTLTDDRPSGHRPRPPADASPRAMLEASGTVKMALHGPRGDLNGVLLTDGSMIHLPPREAARLSSQLAPGQTVLARGEGSKGPLGEVIGAEQIGPDAAHLTTIARPPHPPRPPAPGPGPGPDGEGPDAHGPGPAGPDAAGPA